MSNVSAQMSNDDIQQITDKITQLIHVLDTAKNDLSEAQIIEILPLSLSIENQLMRQYKDEISYKAYQFENNSDYVRLKGDIRDICHDAYYIAIENTARGVATRNYRGESTIKTYFSKIFNNKIVDAIRHKTTKKEKLLDFRKDVSDVWDKLSDASKALVNKETDIQNLMESKESNTIIEKSFNQLGARCQIINKLRFQLKLTHEQVEQILQIFGDFQTYNREVAKECVKKLRFALVANGI